MRNSVAASLRAAAASRPLLVAQTLPAQAWHIRRCRGDLATPRAQQLAEHVDSIYVWLLWKLDKAVASRMRGSQQLHGWWAILHSSDTRSTATLSTTQHRTAQRDQETGSQSILFFVF